MCKQESLRSEYGVIGDDLNFAVFFITCIFLLTGIDCKEVMFNTIA